MAILFNSSFWNIFQDIVILLLRSILSTHVICLPVNGEGTSQLPFSRYFLPYDKQSITQLSHFGLITDSFPRQQTVHKILCIFLNMSAKTKPISTVRTFTIYNIQESRFYFSKGIFLRATNKEVKWQICQMWPTPSLFPFLFPTQNT